MKSLMSCAAFDGKENCQQCEHHWENHLHVKHELGANEENERRSNRKSVDKERIQYHSEVNSNSKLENED